MGINRNIRRFIISKLSFSKYYGLFCLVGKEARDEFLEIHKPNPVITIGAKCIYEPENAILGYKETYAVEIYEEGRAMKLAWNDKIKIVDGKDVKIWDDKQFNIKGAHVPTYNPYFDNTTMDWDVEKSVAVIPFGIIYELSGYIPNSATGEKCYSKAKVLEWIQKLKSIKPGDAITTVTGSKYTVSLSLGSEDSIKALPKWYLPGPSQDVVLKPYHLITTSKMGTMVTLKDVKTIKEEKPTASLLVGNMVIIKDIYVVAHVSGYPIFRVENTYESSYLVKILGGDLTLHLKSSFPMVSTFTNLQAVSVWRSVRIGDLKRKLITIEPGDMVSKMSKYGEPVSKFLHVKSIEQIKVNTEIAVLDNSEFSEDDDEDLELNAKIDVVVKKFNMGLKQQPIFEYDVDNILRLKSLESIDIDGWNVRPLFLFDVQVGTKKYYKVTIERVVNNGIVFDGNFHSTDKIKILHNYSQNGTKRKEPDSILDTQKDTKQIKIV